MVNRSFQIGSNATNIDSLDGHGITRTRKAALPVPGCDRSATG